MPRLILRALAGVSILSGLSCGGDGATPITPPPARVLTSVSVVLSPASVQAGQTATASATGADQNGAAMTLGTVVWSTSNSDVATVNSAGSVNAVSVGTVQIAASTGGKVGQATLTVTAASVAAVRVTPTPVNVAPGSTTQLSAATLDAGGNVLTGRALAWSSSDITKATVTQSGLVAGVAAGTVSITATSEGVSGQASITVLSTPPVPVATVTVTPAAATIVAGANRQLSAAMLDANGGLLAGRTVQWSTSDAATATVSNTGLVTGVAPGTATIMATSEGKIGSAAITIGVPAAQCTSANSLKLALGETRSFSATDAAALCLGGVAAATEFVLIPFNNSPVAASITPFQLESTNTIVIQTGPNLGVIDAGRLALQRATVPDARVGEDEFRRRALQNIPSPRARQHVSRSSTIPGGLSVGAVIQLNSSLNGNICTSARVNHPARLVAQLQHTMLFVDTLSPPGGYTDDELLAFAQAFDTVAYALDTLNFGAETDIDNNGKIAIFFTPGINSIPAPSGGFVGGLFAARDLFSTSPTTGCVASNQGEMFYLPVPDPQSTINGNYTNKTGLARIVGSTLAHEFQHLINAGRRIYVNDADDFEQIWLSEGLSHIAEELLYYRMSGNVPRVNLALSNIAATQPLVDAFNANMGQNFGRLRLYMLKPATSSPYSMVDGLEMRGAIWQLLRYAADQKGTNERDLWWALANARTNGAINFGTVLGDVISLARDWSVAQFIDDVVLNAPAKYTNRSWNFRSILPAVNNNQFPLATSQLIGGSPLSLQLVGGGTAYVRFRIPSTTLATIAASASGQPLASNIDFVLVRTQ